MDDRVGAEAAMEPGLWILSAILRQEAGRGRQSASAEAKNDLGELSDHSGWSTALLRHSFFLDSSVFSGRQELRVSVLWIWMVG